MTSPRYYNVTHFWTDPNEILHNICKTGNEIHFVIEIFLISGVFIDKITINYENHVYCPDTLNLSPPPHPLWVAH